MCVNSIDFRQGDRFPNLVLLGACPGQDEFRAIPQRPFVGRAGVNLQTLLEIIQNLPDKEAYGLRHYDFYSNNPNDYTLMNSHAEAKWRAQHRRTTPRMQEVEERGNLDRIRDQLRFVEARVVIGLGRPIADRALTVMGKDSGPMRAIRKLAADFRNTEFLVSGHPSPQAINRYAQGNAQQWFQGTLRRFEL